MPQRMNRSVLGQLSTWRYFARSGGSLVKLARRTAQRIGTRARPRPAAVPKLAVSLTPTSEPPTAWFICPDHEPPSGGIRKLYRCVDILNDAGLDAAIIHTRPGFRCGWFANTTRVVSAHDVRLEPRDILVVPEIYGRTIRDLPLNIRQVIFNQNAYNTLQSLMDGPANATPYTSNPDLALVMVVSRDNAEVIEHTFPGIPVRRLRLGIDPALYHPPKGPKQRRIVYMPRKRPGDAARVVAMLHLRGALDGWDIVAIDGRSEAEAAEMLRTAKLFLSFSSREGFGLPPVEALACGCVVIGYHGFGGREYFRPPFATAVEDGDIAAFVRTVEATIHSMDSDPRSADSIMAAASRFVFERYALETEKQDLLNIFSPLLDS
jgi:glycosyltransferase involved in cell wall biosynthesis